nr:unnamed protein product [Digitaria exilis]
MDRHDDRLAGNSHLDIYNRLRSPTGMPLPARRSGDSEREARHATGSQKPPAMGLVSSSRSLRRRSLISSSSFLIRLTWLCTSSTACSSSCAWPC